MSTSPTTRDGHAPGTGTLDLAHRLNWLMQQSYDGRIGLEYKPGTDTSATFARTRALRRG